MTDDFAATVEAVLRAEDLLKAFAAHDSETMGSILVDNKDDSDRTIYALLLMCDSAIKDIAKSHSTSNDLAREGLRAWILGSQVEGDTNG